MHRHRDENRTTPLISNGETTSQDKERYERWEVRVGGGEEERVHDHPEKTAKVAFEDPVQKKPEKKFLNHRRNCYGENNDHDSLLDCARATEKLDDVLLARAASEKALGNEFAHEDQRISEKQQDCSSAQDPQKTNFEEAP